MLKPFALLSKTQIIHFIGINSLNFSQFLLESALWCYCVGPPLKENQEFTLDSSEMQWNLVLCIGRGYKNSSGLIISLAC
mmetsp:Transcript_21056/g.33891  ORF Transcript_21056/g.33891 Transcript_21056/m.33891 type:complete len:80 (-) Transcript_21056:1451-1690(-)